jgi:hypothetical protein
MALAFYFAPTTVMSARKYDECIAALKKAGQAHPPGRLYHSAFGTSDSVQVFDVWTSQEAFEAFGQTLMPIMAGLGLDPGEPRVMSVHNIVVPPGSKPKAAATKKTAARMDAAPEKKASKKDKKNKKDKKKKKKKKSNKK